MCVVGLHLFDLLFFRRDFPAGERFPIFTHGRSWGGLGTVFHVAATIQICWVAPLRDAVCDCELAQRLWKNGSAVALRSPLMSKT